MDTFAAWIQILSQIITTVIAVVMAYLSWQTYLKSPEQASAKTVDNVTELVIFDTSKQTTTLRASSDGLQCYLLNKETNVNKLQWTISKAIAKQVLRQDDIHTRDHKVSTGLLSIGPRKNWLYSKRLHPNHNYFKDDIIALLESI